ncbi:MAG: helix-turn-helix transcriptional regulator [Alphaproteobacteria bacterium]|nr:helix-turn-helix transcriptional regulator [Alphaproteobacteria bacterium]MBR4316292.1 helix-turn-helix transcriptional regulator [Alphaproteobacteria bacterium]
MTRQLNDNNKLFLKLIFGARKKAGLTQKKLADMLKKNQSYISKYENGDRRLDVIEFMEVVNAIGVSPLEIIGEIQKNWKKK